MQEAPGALGNDESYRKKEYGHARAARERAGWDCVFIGRRRVQCVRAATVRGRIGAIARMGGEEGVNRVFLYELRHTRIPKYSTHKPQSARDSSQRRDRTHKFRTHAAALHAPRARNHHTHNSRSPLLPLSHSALAARLLSYPRLPASLNQHPLFQSPLAHKHSSHSFCVHHPLKRAHEGGPTPAAGLRP